MEHLREIFKIREINSNQETNFSLRNYSDFSLWTQAVRQIYKKAVINAITHLSITDIATIWAYKTGRAMNIWKWFWLQIIPWLESAVKITEKTNQSVDMLLYFSEKLLKDNQFIKDVRDAIEMWKYNWWTDLSDILYLRNRYDIASIIANPFDDNLSEIEMKAFIDSMVNKWEIDWFYSDLKANNDIPNWYEVPIFIWNDETKNKFWTTSSIENRDFEILSRKGDLWIMIWRFWPPHIGHIRVIKKALRENWKLFLFLWSANVVNERNPFTAEERLFFFNFYFKQEIESGILNIWTLDDVGNYEKWVWILWKEIWKIFPDFKWKVNFYWWDMKEDMAINAINQYENLLWLEKIAYREIEREDFIVNHDWAKIPVSATAVRNALSSWDYCLANKLMNSEIAELVIHKWKEKNELLEENKLFFVYTPEFDKDWNIHRNYIKSEKIRKQVDSDFNQKNIVSDINNADTIVVIWWDWSLLWAIKEYWGLRKPFYPIAAWTKNFIPSNFTHPYQILTEENEVLEFPLLDVKFYDDKWKNVANEVALNDVYLNVESWTMWTLMVEWSDYPSRVVEGDWLIVSTPIWSTAYTKKAGWNVLPLNNKVLSITDIASVWNISHTVDSNQTITIDVIRWKFTAHADSFKINNISKIKVLKSPKKVKIILPVDWDFRRNRYVEK